MEACLFKPLRKRARRANEIAKIRDYTVFSKQYKNCTMLSLRKNVLGTNSKELVLDQTNSELNKAKSRTIHTIKYD